MKYFHGAIRLEVPESVYYPREDSELMAGRLEKTGLAGKEVLEIGCGSGMLSIIAAKQGCHVTCVDINTAAVEATRQNARMNGAEVSCARSDLFQNVHGKFDFIVFNPPYLPTEEGESDPTYAGGQNGRDVIEKFLKDAPRFLQPAGKILLLISSLTGEQEVIELARKAGLKAIATEREKAPWEELIVIEASR